MALDKVVLNPGALGNEIGTDRIAGIDYEVVKSAFGVAGSLTLVSAADPLPVTDAAAASIDVKLTTPTTILNGLTVVTTAGTRVVLAASTVVKSVTVKALSTNTGLIYVGNATVAAANGFQLSAGDTISMDIANLNTVNIDSSVNLEGVSYLGVV